MTTERRTLLGWFAYLDDPKRELTLSEYMALMLFNTREYARVTMEMARETKDAAEHAEAMLGALDALAAQLAAMSGLPYPSSGDVRRALAAQRRQEPRETALTPPDGSRAAP